MHVSWLWTSQYHIAVLGTVAALIASWLAVKIGGKVIEGRTGDDRDRYRRMQALNTFVLVLCVLAIALLWARKLQHTGTFLGLLGAGLAIALREPLLSIAGRIAIFAGKMYSVGDRIELDKMSGDVIGVGFFYTRMMEIGNWIGADQYSGRIIQFANARVFGTPVMNYTQNFSYIWDEITFALTYQSNVAAAKQIMEEVGGDYTREFLQGAQEQLDRMRHYFLVPETEVKPHVYTKVTDNYLQLTMRYVVDPKKRRAASSFIGWHIFGRFQQRNDIQIGSQTMSVTLQAAQGQGQMPNRLQPGAEGQENRDRPSKAA
jgi:small-conductance mechanosensitive channel